MNISDLRDAQDSAADAAATSFQRVSNISLPDMSRLSDVSLPDVSLSDVSLPDALDFDVADAAGNAIDFAGDAAGVVVTEGGRGAARAIRYTRQNPKAVLGVAALVALVIGFMIAKRRSSEPSLDDIS